MRVIYLRTTDRQAVNYYSTIHAIELIISILTHNKRRKHIKAHRYNEGGTQRPLCVGNACSLYLAGNTGKVCDHQIFAFCCCEAIAF